MADNPIGVHIQGVSDEGNPVEDGYPVVVAFEGSDGNKEVPNIGAHGGVLTEPAPGAPDTVVDQGLPNAGGALAWPVQQVGRPNETIHVFTAAGQSVAIPIAGYGTAAVEIEGDGGSILQFDLSNNNPDLGVGFWGSTGWSYNLGAFFFNTISGNDLLSIGSAGAEWLTITALPGWAGTTTVKVNLCPAATFVTGVLGAELISDIADVNQSPNLRPRVPLNVLDNTAIYFPSIPTLRTSSTYQAERTPDKFHTATAAAAGSTALWTPAAGKKFRLMRYQIDITDDATLAAAGILTVDLLDGAGNIAQTFDCFVPAVALKSNGLIGSTGWQDLGNGILSAAANNVLNISLSAALVTGRVRARCCGTEE